MKRFSDYKPMSIGTPPHFPVAEWVNLSYTYRISRKGCRSTRLIIWKEEHGMPFVKIAPDVYEFNNGPVNIWLIASPDGLTLIDTCYKGREQVILDAVTALGRKPTEIRNILLTHCHPDHAGSLSALKNLTGAQAWMHSADGDVVRGKAKMKPSVVSPGLINQLLFQLFIKTGSGSVPAAGIEHELQDGEYLPMTAGLKAVHTPGHSAGHMAFLLERDEGVLFIGDACSNAVGLDYSILYEDIQQGRESLRKLAGLKADVICFSHGKFRKGAAADQFRKKWA
jgi:glyoxylase-like metal-dependent hydrolase (beta-lactamase superfamily II)